MLRFSAREVSGVFSTGLTVCEPKSRGECRFSAREVSGIFSTAFSRCFVYRVNAFCFSAREGSGVFSTPRYFAWYDNQSDPFQCP
jgi:hypothetical protein